MPATDRVPYAGFVGSAFAPQSPNTDLQELINYYLERSESEFAKSPNTLLPCPGFTTWVTLPTSPVRGLWAQNDRFFAVGGSVLYELARDGTITTRAFTTLTTPSAPTVTPSTLAAAIVAPDQPLITQGGTVGATAYGYKVTAINSNGETEASVEGTTAVGNATLSSSNFNQITWAAVTGASGYKVYRTTGGATPPKLIGVVAAPTLFLIDVGTGTAATPPSVNTTGGTAGATTYGYKIVAKIGIGHTDASLEGTTFTGQATLDEDNYNTVTWPAVPNAIQYDVYRTTGGTAPPVLLGSTAELTLVDSGQDGDSETPPTTNTTSTFSLENDGQPVSWASSGDAGNQILIGSGGGAYCFDLNTATLGKSVDGATTVGYNSTYFLVLDAATSTLKVSESLDGYTFDDGQNYQRTSSGDRWLGMGLTENEVWLFGSQTTDVWRSTGDDETRFAPYQDVTIDQGTIATASIQSDNGVFRWIGQGIQGAGIIWQSNGYRAERISTHGIERRLASFSTLADAVGWSYEQEGHTFNVFNFPSDGETWVYDQLTQQWHQRAEWDSNAGEFSSYRANCHAFAFGGVGFGMHLAGDRDSGVIAIMSTDVGVDIGGGIIRRVRQAPHVSDRLFNLTIWGLVIDLEVGEGIVTGQGSDPTIMLQASRNGGKTWGNERWFSAGAMGAYSTRVYAKRWGDARDWVFRMVVTDPTPWRISGAWLDPEAGTS